MVFKRQNQRVTVKIKIKKVINIRVKKRSSAKKPSYENAAAIDIDKIRDNGIKLEVVAEEMEKSEKQEEKSRNIRIIIYELQSKFQKNLIRRLKQIR